jgi:heme oxygenase (biliverdin-IX-beta and delta-forming)
VTLLSELRAATGDAHASIERQVPLLARVVSADTYRWYLRAMLGFHAPVESALRALGPDFEANVQLARRSKVEALRADLASLGETGPFGTCSALPRVASRDHGYGVLYVLEGSTLGGLVLKRHLDSVLDITHASRFLHVYGRDVSAMWKAFGDALEAHAARADTDRLAVREAASQTFATLERWLIATQAAS